jgi:hypothetical protein
VAHQRLEGAARPYVRGEYTGEQHEAEQLTILERLPGTVPWALARLDLRAQAAVRAELRRLRRDLDALYAGVWLGAARDAEVVAFSGEREDAPHPFPSLASTVPSFEHVRDAAGQERAAVVFPPQLGRGMPRAGLIVVEPARYDAPVLFDAVEASGERIEAIVVAELALAACGRPPRRESPSG